jgi:type VI secretion system secreted protein Hcp
MAVDYFLELDGIDGESKDSKHQDWIELGSFSFGATQTGSFSLQRSFGLIVPDQRQQRDPDGPGVA